MSQYKLTTELLKLSHSSKWDQAKLEWEIEGIEKVEEPETCLCGHYPIKEVCLIYNKLTHHTERVGNCCVKKFDEKSDKIFRAVARVTKHVEKSVNSETLEFAFDHKWIDLKSYDFYIDILRKKKLSPKQLAWKRSINETIVRKINKSKQK